MMINLRMRISALSLLFAVILAPTALHAEDASSANEGEQHQEAHLASYRTKADAERGWGVLAADYSSILYFHPAIREVDLPRKGHFFRLFAAGDSSVMESLCSSLHEKKLYCVMMTVR